MENDTHTARVFRNTARLLKKGKLYTAIRKSTLLPSLSTHACKKDNLLRLVHDGDIYSALPKENIAIPRIKANVPLSALHDIAKKLFFNKTNKVLFHEDEFGNKDYYLTLIYNLDRDAYDRMLRRYDPKNKPVFKIALDSSDNGECRTNAFKRFQNTERSTHSLPNLRLRDDIFEFNPTSFQKKELISFGQRKIIQEIMKLCKEYKKKKEFESASARVIGIRREELVNDISALEQVTKDQTILDRLSGIKTDLWKMLAVKDSQSALEFSGLRGNYSVYLKNAFRKKRKLDTNIRDTISIKACPYVSHEELIKIGGMFDSEAKYNLILLAHNSRRKQNIFSSSMQLSRIAIEVAKEEGLLILKEFSDRVEIPVTKSAIALHYMNLQGSNSAESRRFVSEIAHMFLTSGNSVFSPSCSAEDLLKIFSFKNIDIKVYTKRMFLTITKELAVGLSGENAIERLAKFIYKSQCISLINTAFKYVNFVDLNTEYIINFLLCIPHIDCSDYNIENFIPVYRYIIQAHFSDINIRTKVLENLTIFTIIDIDSGIARGDTSLANFTKMAKKVLNSTTWVEKVKKVVTLSKEVNLLCYILTPTKTTISTLVNFDGESKRKIQMYISNLACIYICEKFYFINAKIFKYLRIFFLKTVMDYNLSKFIGTMLIPLLSLVSFETKDLGTIYAISLEIYNEYRKEYTSKVIASKKKNLFACGKDIFPRTSEEYTFGVMFENYRNNNNPRSLITTINKLKNDLLGRENPAEQKQDFVFGEPTYIFVELEKVLGKRNETPRQA